MLEQLLTTNQLPIWADEFAAAVAAAYRPDCIILFGSVARNTQQQDSDIDIIVIGGDLPASHRERFRLLMNLRPRLAPLQVQSFTLAEWDSMMKKKHLSVLEALTDGKALYGQQLFNRWRRQLRRWQTQGLHRTRFAWVIPPLLREPGA